MSICGIAQSDSLPTIACPVDVMPSFLGGQEALMKFVKENLKYPEKERAKGITGKCIIGFVVETDGSISSVKVVKGIKKGPGCNKEAVRVVKSMPNWSPGIQNGKKVRVQFNLPVNFSLK